MKAPLKLLRDGLALSLKWRDAYRRNGNLEGEEEYNRDIADIEAAIALLENRMTEERARKILGNIIMEDGSLHVPHPIRRGLALIHWHAGIKSATLNYEFTADQLEAIAWWVRNKTTIE